MDGQFCRQATSTNPQAGLCAFGRRRSGSLGADPHPADAAVAGAIGLVIYPDAIIEIISGVFVIIGGIELWKREAEGE